MSEREELRRIFLQNPEFFFIYISKNYPLKPKQIEYLDPYLDWVLIAYNREIEFTIPFVWKYRNRLLCYDLACNPAVRKNKEVMEYFNLYWEQDWDDLELVTDEDFDPRIRYHHYSMEEIEEKKDEILWVYFSSNDLINWEYDLLCKYREYLYLGEGIVNGMCSFSGLGLFNNRSVPWDIKAILLFENQLFPADPWQYILYAMNPSFGFHLKVLLDEEMFIDIICKLT